MYGLKHSTNDIENKKLAKRSCIACDFSILTLGLYELIRRDPCLNCLVRAESSALRSNHTLKILNLFGHRNKLELDWVVRELASLAVLALALGHNVWAHLGLARFELDSLGFVFEQILLDTFLAELLSKLCNLLKAFNVLLHLLNVAMLLELARFALQVEVFDAAVKEDVLIVRLVVEWAHLLNKEAHSCQGSTRTELALGQVLICDILRVLLLEICALRQLKSIIKAELKLPS